MSPRVALPGADELFRATSPSRVADGPAVPEPVADAAPSAPPADGSPRPGARTSGRSRAPRGQRPRSSTGRERHEEKITVYVSAHELVDLEQARLVLRAEHGVAVDRGRIVREALSVLLADLEDKGGDSILVRRLTDGG